MASLSRMEKYKNLRDGLQNDTGSTETTKELSRFERRLNRIDAQNFSAPQEVREDVHEAQHARVQEPVPEPVLSRTQSRNKPVFDENFMDENENSSGFDNDFLDQYIREVKQYNIDQGNAVSENTQVNVLKNIREKMPETPAPSKPYPPKPKDNDTADIPFMNSRRRKYEDAFENTEKIPVTTSYKEEPSQNLTKEDIMAEVQNLVNGSRRQGYLSDDEPAPAAPAAPAYDKSSYEDDRTTRQQLLNETTQMRAQLDDYEDNLNEVNDKMRQTNRILNIVLIVLIIALIVILGIVIYWIVISRM